MSTSSKFTTRATDAIKSYFGEDSLMCKVGSAAINELSSQSANLNAKTILGRDGLAHKILNGGDEAAWYKMKFGEGENEYRISGAKAAAGFMGASSAFRLASGGGIYRDKDGNTDIIGIPFI